IRLVATPICRSPPSSPCVYTPMASILLSTMRGSSTLLLGPTMRRVVLLIELQFSRCSYTDFGDVDAPATCLQVRIDPRISPGPFPFSSVSRGAQTHPPRETR